jgi:hypothetical protein
MLARRRQWSREVDWRDLRRLMNLLGWLVTLLLSETMKCRRGLASRTWQLKIIIVRIVILGYLITNVLTASRKTPLIPRNSLPAWQWWWLSPRVFLDVLVGGICLLCQFSSRDWKS